MDNNNNEKFLYRPLKRYISPSSSMQLEIISASAGKFIGLAFYEDERWGDAICWLKEDGTRVEMDHENDMYRVHEPREWKYINRDSFKTAPSWVKFLWENWRITKHQNMEDVYVVKDIQCMDVLELLHPGDILYLGNEVDEFGNLYPNPYTIKNDADIPLKTNHFASDLREDDICLYVNSGYLHVCKCTFINKENGIVQLMNVKNGYNYIVPYSANVWIINNGYKL